VDEQQFTPPAGSTRSQKLKWVANAYADVLHSNAEGRFIVYPVKRGIAIRLREKTTRKG